MAQAWGRDAGRTPAAPPGRRRAGPRRRPTRPAPARRSSRPVTGPTSLRRDQEVPEEEADQLSPGQTPPVGCRLQRRRQPGRHEDPQFHHLRVAAGQVPRRAGRVLGRPGNHPRPPPPPRGPTPVGPAATPPPPPGGGGRPAALSAGGGARTSIRLSTRRTPSTSATTSWATCLR